ncbi:hypothetical protein [Actinomadura rubrisoli]|uniref:Uncharacterized protein n=1 Tax=Actinomadura rubrisoli TaxID=2530368 RepID=A0A4R5B9S6_9ACTN|nr:hypothetical protein [Actinomadura rubrisoli]TDD82771.1 hypothetical protein E1298_22265 [Actinomadura rubrisoli]
MLGGVHVLIEVNGVPLLNSSDVKYGHVIGAHPDPFFASGSALFSGREAPAFLAVGDPVDCRPECCGVGARIWRRGDRVRWRLDGDRWNRDQLSAELEFDREEYLFAVECARDAWFDVVRGRGGVM